MTRVCGHCKTVIGEKCGRCGSERVVCRQGLVKPFWTCLNCDYRWFEGQGPATTGICEACLAKAFPESVKVA